MKQKFVLDLVVLSLLLGVASRALSAEPIVVTAAPSGQSNAMAQLQGMVNPNGQTTVAWFEWGTATNNHTQSGAPNSVGSGNSAVAISNVVSGLTPGGFYYGRAVASNSAGVVRGEDVMFGSPALKLNGAATMTSAFGVPFSDPEATAWEGLLAVDGGFHFSLALKRDGTIVAWGFNSSGQANVPAGLSNVVTMSAGGNHTLALKRDGTVTAWGLNDYGETDIPAGLSNVVAVAAGSGHSLALRSNGTVEAWGWNGFGQMNVPTGLSNVIAIAGGSSHSLALKSDGTVVAWGDNFYGQTNVPIGLSNVMAIAGGGAHSLALRSNGTVAAWGWNESGQTNVPAGLSNVVAVAGGSGHSLALRSDGTVEAWGWDGGSGQMNVPTGLSNVVAIAAASFHNLAIKSDGTVVAWGGTTVPAGLTAVAVVASTSFNPHVPGAYTVTYTAVNSLGGINSVTRTVIVLPPALGVPTRLGNGAIRFNFPFTSNGTCTVLASTNVGLPINAWNNLGAALESPASSGHFQFTDVQATNYPRRFYLIRSP